MPEQSNEFFRVERDSAVVHLIMDRPDRSNAMSPDFWSGLPRHLDALGRDETVRCAIISGEGRNFTGGMDLSAFADIARLFDNEPGRAAYAMRDVILNLQDAFNAIERARFPVIAAIHGACIGAGVDLITACDMRIASSDAFFAIEEIHIGMAADVGTIGLSGDEVMQLRNYLLKGGFLIFDDFRDDHWFNLEAQMRKVFPDLRWIELDATHPVYHSFFDINALEYECIYCPAIPIFYGLFEDNDPAGTFPAGKADRPAPAAPRRGHRCSAGLRAAQLRDVVLVALLGVWG